MKNLKMVKDSLKSICLTNKHLEVKDLLKKQKFWMNKYGHFALDRKETEIFYKIANFIKNEYKIGNLAIDVSEKDIENYLLILISKVLILSSQQKKNKIN
ncbi:MAG: hypothetical protein U9P73_08725 [Candidatus Cloacimonadota bacterium]|nr:hypothetical protein [Candidatus Cloacimonadota bacterium]